MNKFSSQNKQSLKNCINLGNPMNRLFFLLFSILVFGISPNILIANVWSSIDFRSIITGIWVDRFPVGSGYNSQYTFNDDNTFEFKYTPKSNQGYFRIEGNWKLNGPKLLIQYNSNDWKLVSDLRSFNPYWFPEGYERNFPPLVSMRYFKNKKLTAHIGNYFKKK